MSFGYMKYLSYMYIFSGTWSPKVRETLDELVNSWDDKPLDGEVNIAMRVLHCCVLYVRANTESMVKLFCTTIVFVTS